MDGTALDRVRPMGGDVFEIDTRMGGHAGIAAGYLIRSERPCLVETGTATSAELVRDSLLALGVSAGDLATVVVTHIHLDHAGGVGDIAAMFPAADVVVQERGARHLVDPDRLMASARRVFGDDVIDTMFGPLRATDAARVRAIGDEGRVDLGGGRELIAWRAPGHASHHLGLLDSSTGDLYTGDAAGIYVPETADVRPATPPPDFDLELTLASMQRFRDARPTRLLFSHYGPVLDVDEVLDRSEQELRLWVETVRESHQAGMDVDHAIAMVRERDQARHPDFAGDVELEAKFEALSSTAANVIGIRRWLDQQPT